MSSPADLSSSDLSAVPDLALLPSPVAPVVISAAANALDEFETHLAVAPDGTIAANWTVESTSGPFPIGYAFSTDHGQTFTAPARVAAPGGLAAADSMLVVDGSGTFTLVFLAHGATSHIYAARSTGTTFGTPVEVSPGAGDYDKPWAVVTGSGSLLVTYESASAGVTGRSSNGVNFSPGLITVGDGTPRGLFFPCVSDSGRVWVVFKAGASFAMRWSDDDGSTFTTSDSRVSLTSETDIPFSEPECVAAGAEVWFVYGLSHDPDSSVTGDDPKLYQLRIAHAQGSGGVDARYTVADANAGAFFLHPQIAREPGGALALTYYTGAANLDVAGSFRRTRSTDGGQTFSASTAVKMPDTLVQTRADSRWPGDYSGLVAQAHLIFMTFIDNTSGKSHVAFTSQLVP
jgi:hypothetical protein